MEDSSRIDGISHVSLSISDLHRSLEFYQDVMRLHLIQPPSRGTKFDGDQAMLLITDDMVLALQCHDHQEPGAFTPTRHGLDHLAFSVATREALADWAMWLDQSSCSHTGIMEVEGGGAKIELHDPDGIQIELYANG